MQGEVRHLAKMKRKAAETAAAAWLNREDNGVTPASVKVQGSSKRR
jgi:hypothetical protein